MIGRISAVLLLLVGIAHAQEAGGFRILIGQTPGDAAADPSMADVPSETSGAPEDPKDSKGAKKAGVKDSAQAGSPDTIAATPPAGDGIRLDAPAEPAGASDPGLDPADATPTPSKAKSKKKASSRRSRPRKWGASATITPVEAARQAESTPGNLIEFARSLVFVHDSTQLAADAAPALSEVVEYLQATPELRLVLIEGHTDATGSLRYNQRLSEARATAVRAALIERGVSADRLVAYGYGETRPATAEAKHNRRVVFRIVEGDRQAMVRRAATEWGEAAIVGLWGPAESAPGLDIEDADGDTRTPSDSMPDQALAWAPLALRDQLGEGVDIRTGPDGTALLRLPDLSRLWLGGDTRVHVSKLFYDHRIGKAYVAIRVHRGTLRAMVNPLERTISRTLVAMPGGTIETVAADFELQVASSGMGRLRIDRGAVDLSVGANRALYAGQIMRLGAGAVEPTSQATPPDIVSPLTGRFAQSPPLVWHPVPEAAAYVVEVAEDVDFYRMLVRARTPIPRFETRTLASDTRFYWRVRTVDRAGNPGAASRVHAFSTAPRPGGETSKAVLSIRP